jgi:hypothetical protein
MLLEATAGGYDKLVDFAAFHKKCSVFSGSVRQIRAFNLLLKTFSFVAHLVGGEMEILRARQVTENVRYFVIKSFHGKYHHGNSCLINCRLLLQTNVRFAKRIDEGLSTPDVFDS